MKKLGERGVSAVEFALLLPVLVLIIFGIVEFGLIIYDKAVITNASREVARAGITQGANITNIKTDVVNKYKNNLITFGSDKLGDNANDIIVKIDSNNDGNFENATCSDFTLPFGYPLQVTVSYNYNFLVLAPIMGLFGGSWNSTFPLAAITTMRCE
ncbi:MAG: pilus assembly protein [Deltaproteobacteria bacterium HGW-Deltaproteobacteria-7]|nr:MAG: pilus assembly protein [Deltaproteobacteria bacterium HGW-Deltaproteobacteria-7]PKN52151.1 MAG: pilus assembly protein [Deltaproteobacteria bacterium HGW-Deltaproteobacteria-13]